MTSRTVIVLLPRLDPPCHIARDDGPVHSFLCCADVLGELRVMHPQAGDDEICYLLLRAILDRTIVVDRLLIRQLPVRAESARLENSPRTALIMAHRGSIEHLRTALTYLPVGENLTARVGLDIDNLDEYSALARTFPGIQFFHAQSAPAGPYFIRQRLAELSPEPFIMFHDSDDISCADRAERLHEGFAAQGCGMIGSHELVVDETAHEVRAVRYPLDVSGALRDGPHYAILHPATMISRDAFFAAGGFSTDRIISQDTQFHFRAWFHMKMRNVDHFLYIRRKHAASLTTHPETKIGSEFRRAIERPWFPDFEAVKSGGLPLADSTLVARSTASPHELLPLT